MDLGDSSTSFRIHCLEFYFPRHSVASPLSPPHPTLPSLSFVRVILLPFFPSSSRCHPADRSAGHQRGFIPHSGTGVISHGWIGNPLSLRAPTSAHLPPVAALGCSTPSPMPIRPLDGRLRRASEFAYSRKVRAPRRRSPRNRPAVNPSQFYTTSVVTRQLCTRDTC